MDGDHLKRHDLTDEEWERLESLLPPQNVHGARLHAPLRVVLHADASGQAVFVIDLR